MDALVLAGITIIIFGGAQFIVGLLYFWVRTMVDNHRMRIHNRLILERAYRHHMGLY